MPPTEGARYFSARQRRRGLHHVTPAALGKNSLYRPTQATSTAFSLVLNGSSFWSCAWTGMGLSFSLRNHRRGEAAQRSTLAPHSKTSVCVNAVCLLLTRIERLWSIVSHGTRQVGGDRGVIQRSGLTCNVYLMILLLCYCTAMILAMIWPFVVK